MNCSVHSRLSGGDQNVVSICSVSRISPSHSSEEVTKIQIKQIFHFMLTLDNFPVHHKIVVLSETLCANFLLSSGMNRIQVVDWIQLAQHSELLIVILYTLYFIFASCIHCNCLHVQACPCRALIILQKSFKEENLQRGLE